MSPPSSPVPFRAKLEAQRAALVRSIGAAIQVKIERYRGVPEAEWLASVDGVAAVFLGALEELRPEEIRRWALDRMERSAAERAGAGAGAGTNTDNVSLDAMVSAIAIARDELVQSAREGVEAREPGAWEAVRLFTTVHDVISAALVEHALKRSEAASRELAATEEHYRSLYLRTPVMMYAIDPSGSLVTVSDRWLDTLGFAREEVLGRKSAEFMAEGSRRYAREIGIPTLERAGFFRDVPYELVSKSGEIIPVLLSAITERDERGRVTRFIAVMTDVRDRTRAENALRESEERFRILVELAPLAVAVHQGGVVVYANPAAARLLGAASPSEILGREAMDFIHPDSVPIVIERMRRMAETGEAMPVVEETFVRLDGSVIHADVAVAPTTFEGGPAVQVACLDASERRRTHEALRRAEVQEGVIRTQEAMLRALATPLIPVGEGVLVMPLVGAIDGPRARQILEALLAGVAAHRARSAIIDVTGVPELDGAVADALLRAARAVRLLGAEAVLTGLSPSVAQGLAGAGVDLGGLSTRATLRDGIAHALAPRSSR